jgi:predicted DCC family thiol-disulfide oxidoreductase YuxK
MNTESGNSSSDYEQVFNLSSQKPIVVYDGECNFCKYWVNKWKLKTLDEVYYIPFQQVPPVFFGIQREQFKKSVYLITRYRRLCGAEAIFELLAIAGYTSLIELYNRIPLLDKITEIIYRLIANYRDFFYKILKIFSPNA